MFCGHCQDEPCSCNKLSASDEIIIKIRKDEIDSVVNNKEALQSALEFFSYSAVGASMEHREDIASMFTLAEFLLKERVGILHEG